MTSPGTHDFRVLDSELLLESPILAVRRDTLAMPGGDTGRREIVEHFGAVAVVAVRDNGEIALVRQYRHSVRARLWELPAGLLDVDGEDEISTAQRELAEEAALAADRWDVLCDLVTSPGFCDETVRVFLARDLHDTQRGEVEHEEADLVLEWTPLATARDMILRGEIMNAIAISGIMTASEVLAGRATPRPVDVPNPWRPTALPRRRREAGLGPDLKTLPL
ncbi:NUDIX domain-containing protein [Corynebacterium comes]|uniref:ADP-ribose pyrophosphatase n=1 Tax=Corynebacterium comes TaxID=2675218 RepID=A0A6B8W0R4_9CORY|nr:NUDIX hydrolase [Corynebacterium comes]QGU04526.1 ADP-ribose pyrophosphatase [Corynebacterium comes]